MAFDGITVANLVKELKETVEGARISKIAQPEKDELLSPSNIPGAMCGFSCPPAPVCPWSI